MKFDLTNSLGCGKEIYLSSIIGFICGVPNAWGEERLCLKCSSKLKRKWAEEDKKQPRAEEIKYLKSIGK